MAGRELCPSESVEVRIKLSLHLGPAHEQWLELHYKLACIESLQEPVENLTALVPSTTWSSLAASKPPAQGVVGAEGAEQGESGPF